MKRKTRIYNNYYHLVKPNKVIKIYCSEVYLAVSKCKIYFKFIKEQKMMLLKLEILTLVNNH